MCNFCDQDMKSHYPLILLSFALLLLSCEAPRDNPLDPGASNYIGSQASLGSIAGKVSTLANAPLTGVLVLTVPGYHGAMSNTQGTYMIENVPAGQYQVFCSSSGYEPDTLDVSVLALQQTNADFRLDALPVFQSFQVTSHYIYQGPQGPPTEYYNIFARARLTDPDGNNDISKVTLLIEDWPDTTMSFNSDSTVGSQAFYSVTITVSPGASLDSIKWKHFTCTAEDESGNSNATPPITIIRIFDDYPLGISPANNDPVSNSPTLLWEAFGEQFYFTYQTRIYRQSAPTLIVWQASAIPPYETSATVDSPLVGDSYFWVVETFDEYGNSARSEPLNFQVPQ